MIFKKTLFKMCVLGLSAGLLLGSCKDYDDDIDQLRDDVAQINETLSGLQNVVSGLEKSIKNGMLISSVADQTDGILVTFSDGSTKKILHGTNGTNGTNGMNGENGQDGNTPVIYIDQDGYWCVTVGEQSQQIYDSNGDPVCAYGQDGEKGDQGDKGDDGDKGADGSHGYSISAQYVDGYLTFTVYDPNDDNTVVEVITTHIRQSGSVVDLVVERSYYYEFIIDAKAYRIARVTPIPSSVKVITPVVLSIKGKRAYALVSISPSNYTDLNNLQLDFAGITRSSDFAFNTPEFAQVEWVKKLSEENDQWNGQYSSNGGEYVVSFMITDDVVDSRYDVIVQYPSVPEEFNSVVAVDNLDEYLKDEYELVTSWAYTRSSNSLLFISDEVTLADPSAVTLNETSASIKSYQDYSGRILVNAEKFPYDLSYLKVEEVRLSDISATYRGYPMSRLATYLQIESKPVEANGTLADFDVLVNGDAIENDPYIAVGGEIVYTITFTVSDYTGISTPVSLELAVTKVRTRASLASSTSLYIPVVDKDIVLDGDDTVLRQALMGGIGYSEDDYSELTMVDNSEIRILKDGAEIAGDFIKVDPFTAGPSKSLTITADKITPTGEYSVLITLPAKDENEPEVELSYFFTVYAPMYIVDIDMSFVKTDLVVQKYADRIDYRIDLKDVVEAHTLTVHPISEMGSVPAPAYILNMNGSIGEKGLKVSQETVTGVGEWTVELYVELESGQRIPVQAVCKGDPTDPYGKSGEMEIQIIADAIESFNLSDMEWPEMNIYADEIVYEQLLTTPLEINIIAEGEFTSENHIVGYTNLLNDSRIAEIKFEMIGIDASGTAVQAENLLEFDDQTNPGQVTLKAVSGVTPWTGTAIQKARITMIDIFDSEPVVQEFTFKVVYN